MMGIMAIGIMSVLLRRKRRRSRSATASMRLQRKFSISRRSRAIGCASPHHRGHGVTVLARRPVPERTAGVVEEPVLERRFEQGDAPHANAPAARGLGDANSPGRALGDGAAGEYSYAMPSVMR